MYLSMTIVTFETLLQAPGKQLFNVDPLLIIFCVTYKRYLKQQNFITLSLIDIRYERVRLCLLLVLSGIMKQFVH
jgi:hypothetical protein